MKQGRILLPLALLACVAIASPIARAVAAPKTATATTKSAKKSYALRQFTGVVTAVDKGSMTVEKTGKAAKTLTFVRSSDTHDSGDVTKDARVTVYYREDGGRLLARKVVVKDALSAAR